MTDVTSIILAVAAAVGVGATFITWGSKIIGAKVDDLGAKVNLRIDELHHKATNERMRVDALETASTQKIERIAKLEAFMETMKDSNARLEAKLDQIIVSLSKR